jgi:hypothetical protein
MSFAEYALRAAVIRDVLVELSIFRSAHLAESIPVRIATEKGATERFFHTMPEDDKYTVLFPDGFSKDSRVSKMSEVATVASVLCSDAERKVIAGAADDTDDLIYDSMYLARDIRDAGKTPFETRRDIATAMAFDGVAAVEAFALLYGYDSDAVATLSAAELSLVFACVLTSGVHLPWETLLSFIEMKIDTSLVSSLMVGVS